MMTLNEIRKLRGMTLSEFSRKSGLSPHTARNLMGYRELYGNPRMDTMVDAARALNAVVTITPKGVTIRARKESAWLLFHSVSRTSPITRRRAWKTSAKRFQLSGERDR